MVFNYVSGNGELDKNNLSGMDGIVQTRVHKVSSFDESKHSVRLSFNYPKIRSNFTGEHIDQLLLPLKNKYKDLSNIDYNKKFDVLLAYGGDGTILRAARNLKHYDTILLSVNGGKLGFLSTMGIKDWKKNFENIFSGKYKLVHKHMARVRHKRNGEVLLDCCALNEVTVSYKSVARLIHVETKVDKKSMCTYNADGLIIATPTGSTAYNLSAGGPIVYPSLRALILTPICSHSFTQKPIVIPGKKKIELLFDKNEAVLTMTIDGQRSFDVKKDDKIYIEMMDHQLQLFMLHGQHFFKTLRQKLLWGENPI